MFVCLLIFYVYQFNDNFILFLTVPLKQCVSTIQSIFLTQCKITPRLSILQSKSSKKTQLQTTLSLSPLFVLVTCFVSISFKTDAARFAMQTLQSKKIRIKPLETSLDSHASQLKKIICTSKMVSSICDQKHFNCVLLRKTFTVMLFFGWCNYVWDFLLNPP